MSFDIYLLPLQPDDDFERAMSLLASLGDQTADAGGWVDARQAAGVVMQLDHRYQPFEKNYAEIARYMKVSEEEARQRYDQMELNGAAENGEPLAQFIFHRTHVVIHCHAGTTPDELDRFVLALCAATGYAAVDPQEGAVLRLRDDGTLA